MTSPVGLHRVIEPVGVLPQAATRLDNKPRNRARRGAHPGGAPQPRRGQLPPARHQSTTATGTRFRAEVLGDHRGARQDAEPVTGSGGMLIGTVRRGRPRLAARPGGGRPGGHPGVADADPAVHRRRPGPLGRPQRSRSRPTATRSCSPGPSRPSPTDLDPELSLAVLDVCGAPALTARIVSKYPDARVAVIGGAGKSGSLVAGRGQAGRRACAPSGSSRCSTRPTGCATWPSPTRSPSPTPATRSPWPRRSPRRSASRPTSPSSASTCRLRARLDPGHRERRHGHLLLDGHLVRRGGTRRGGPRRRRYHDRRQRLRARPRRVRDEPAARRTPGCASSSTPGWPRNADTRPTLSSWTPQTTVYRGGDVNSAAVPRATALAVAGDRITWIGEDADAPAADVTVDLDGALVTPGFVDAHVHTTDTGIGLLGLDLSGTRSARDVLDALEAHAARQPADAIIVGHGWDESAWARKTPPSVGELDRAGGGRQVYLSQVSCTRPWCPAPCWPRPRRPPPAGRRPAGCAATPTTWSAGSPWARSAPPSATWPSGGAAPRGRRSASPACTSAAAPAPATSATSPASWRSAARTASRTCTATGAS